MELLTQADKVVRDFLPELLDAAGEELGARSLRRLGPVDGPASAEQACGLLRELRDLEALQPEWHGVVRECSFWTEAAVMAALRGDASAFAHHVGRANRAMARGLPMFTVH